MQYEYSSSFDPCKQKIAFNYGGFAIIRKPDYTHFLKFECNRLVPTVSALSPVTLSSLFSLEQAVPDTLRPAVLSGTLCCLHHLPAAFSSLLHTEVPCLHSASLPQRTSWASQGSGHRKCRASFSASSVRISGPYFWIIRARKSAHCSMFSLASFSVRRPLSIRT